jgi:hypothetical protein
MTQWLWRELHDFFDIDDGSLPEVRVDYSDQSATATAYALLRARAIRVGSADSGFWSNTLGMDVSLDSVPNAAALVVSGDAAPFHTVLRGIESADAVIPDLGVFVFPDQLALDYRMGPGWGPRELAGLFAILAQLVALDLKSTISLERGASAEATARFQRVWVQWMADRGGECVGGLS